MSWDFKPSEPEKTSDQVVRKADIVYIADPHVSYSPPVGRTALPFTEPFRDKMDWLLQEVRPDTVVVGGDLTHRKTRQGLPNPSWQAIETWARIFRDYSTTKWLLLPGNHDLINNSIRHWQQTPLGVLSEMPNVTVFGVPEHEIAVTHKHGIQFFGVPGDHDLEEYSRLAEAGEIFVKAGSAHVAVAHSWIGHAAPYATIEPEAASSFYEVPLVLCGHIHTKFDWSGSGRRIVSTGPFVRRTVVERSQRPRAICMLADSLLNGDNSVNGVWEQPLPYKNDWKLDDAAVETLHLTLEDVVAEAGEGFGMIDSSNFEKQLAEFIAANMADVPDPITAAAIAVLREACTDESAGD